MEIQLLRHENISKHQWGIKLVSDVWKYLVTPLMGSFQNICRRIKKNWMEMFGDFPQSTPSSGHSIGKVGHIRRLATG